MKDLLYYLFCREKIVITKHGNWAKLKKILGFDNKYDKLVTEVETRRIKFEQSLRVTNWDRPSDTITASVPEIHVNRKRRLTARECAILQSFPDDFVFCGSLSSQHRQIGNAVPPLIGEHLAKTIKRYVQNDNPEKNWKELKMVNAILFSGIKQY